MPLLYTLIALIVVAMLPRLVNAYSPMPSNAKSIVNIVLVLVFVGLLLGLINTYITMAGSIKAILNIVVVIATCVGVLQAVGLWPQIVRIWNDLTRNRA